MDPEETGGQIDAPEEYFQPTAMLDKAELLGELADLQELPHTRAAVETEPSAPRGCRLIVVAGPDLGKEWAFKKPELVIGRDEDCEIVLSDIAVSRRHARIGLDGYTFFLNDLGSGNGTFLNGVRVTQEPLASGDEIIIGERTLRFVELNDAPPTAAAHPISTDAAREPRVSSLLNKASSAKAAAHRSSQVKAHVAPGSLAAAPVEAPAGEEVQPPKKSRWKKVAAVLALAGAVYGGRTYWKAAEERAERERIATSKREFLQGIELVKMRRFGDAVTLFDRVLVARPDYARAAEYRSYAAGQLEIFKGLESARALAEAGRSSEALAKLEELPRDTPYAQDIERAKAEAQAAIAAGLVEESRRKMNAGDLSGALEGALAALTRAPALESAQRLRDEVEDALHASKDTKKKREPPPKEMARPLALYQDVEVGPAIDAAEAIGGPVAAVYTARMRRMKQLLDEIDVAHKAKAAAEILRLVPQALELDLSIAGGEGQVRTRLRRVYADGLYLKGIEAYGAGDYVRAYQLLTESVRQQPGHQLSEGRLAELSRKARDLYFEGTEKKDSDPSEARRIFKRLTQMTPPGNQYHKAASKWLASNGG